MDESPAARVLRLLGLLQSRRSWPGPILAARLGVSGRTLRRDIDRLRELGYAIGAARGREGAYQLDGGSALPPLVLDDDEAIALTIALGAAASSTAVDGIADASLSVLTRMEQVFPSRLRNRVTALREATAHVRMPVDPFHPVDPEVLALLALACRDCERIRLVYSAPDRDPARRSVEPAKLVQGGRRWYLVGWDRDRDDWRTFRVDRISEVFGTRVSFVPRGVPGGDAATFVDAMVAETGARFSATIMISAPRDEVVAHLGGFVDPARLVAMGSLTAWTIQAERPEILAGALVWLPWQFAVTEGAELLETLEGFRKRLASMPGGPV